MSTRCMIGIENANSIDAIYCNYDGFLEGVGVILKKHYNYSDRINELIALGDICMLGAELHPQKDKEHNFDNQQEGVTLAYARDCGEELEITKFQKEGDIFKFAVDSCLDSIFLFRWDRWYYFDLNGVGL